MKPLILGDREGTQITQFHRVGLTGEVVQADVLTFSGKASAPPTASRTTLGFQ